MVNLKEHIKLTGVYTFFAAFPAILQLVVYPIIEGKDRLGAEDFGYLAIAEAIVSFITVFCLFGMAITIARYYYEYSDNKTDYNKLVSTIISGIVLRFLILVLVAVIFSGFISGNLPQEPLKSFDSYGYLLVIIAFNRSVIAVALSLYRSEKTVKNFVAVSIISGIARSTFQIIGVLYFDLSFKGYLMGTAIGGGIASFAIVLYTYINCGFSFSKQIHSQLYGFSSSLFLTDLLFWGILFFDRFLLLKTPISLGIYDNALKFAFGIQFISQGLAGSIQPELFRLFKKGIKENIKDIKTLSNIFIAENLVVIGLLTLPIMFFISFFYETSLALSSGIILIVLMRYIINAMYQVFLWPILYLKETKTYFLLNLIVFGIIILFNLFLVPLYGFYGSIFSFLFAGVVQVVLFYFFQNKKIKIEWNKTKVLFFPIFIVAITGISEILKLRFELSPYFVSFIIVSILFTGLFLIYRKELVSNFQKFINRLSR